LKAEIAAKKGAAGKMHAHLPHGGAAELRRYMQGVGELA
jgi:hypothetical protein